MRKTALNLIVLATALLVVQTGLRSAPDARRDRILAATKFLTGFQDASFTKETLTASLCELMGIVGGLSAGNPHYQDIRFRLDVATDLMRKDSIFNSKARQYLSFAFRMLTNGKKYQSPAELGDFVTPAELQERTSRYAKGLIGRALEALDAGDEERAAALLLEFVLMTITPVEG